MSRPHAYSVLLFLCICLYGCAHSEDTGKTVSTSTDPCDTGVPTPSWAGWGHGFFRTYCGACHAQSASNRHGAPIELIFDTEAQVRLHSESIGRSVLEAGSMPVGGGVIEEDLVLLARYLDCGIGDD